MKHTLTSRLIGFISSLILTLAAFWIIFNPSFFHLSTNMAILSILLLAILQFTVQSIFFLNLLGEKGPRWNLLVYASTLSIVIIIIYFSIWIMNTLNYRMM